MPPNIARTIKGMSGEEMSRRAKDSTGADDLDGLQASNWLAVDVPDRRPAKRTSVSTDQRASVSSNLRDRSSPPIVHVLVPAHNEEHGIAAALASVKAQSSPVGNIVVIADNCTDKTVEIAESFGAEVFTTKNNVDRKAGALNQYLTTLITEISSSDYVLVMDADTILDERFVEIGLREFAKIQPGRPIAGVGGIFLGDLKEWNLVKQLQANEYVRYARHLGRRRGRALVLTGTGTLYSVAALRDIVEARHELSIPRGSKESEVYDTTSMTEDNELTLGVESLGYRAISPKECLVETAMMPTWRRLFEQRKRWQRGALENIHAYGITHDVRPYLLRQILTYITVLFVPFYIETLSLALSRPGRVNLFLPIWIAVAVIYLIEALWTVRSGGWKAILVTLTIIPEVCFALFLSVVYVVCLVLFISGKEERWGRSFDTDSESLMKLRDVPGDASIQASTEHKTFWLLGCLSLCLVILLVLIPIFSIQAAWLIISIFVLGGTAVNLFKLIPLPTS